MPGRGRDIDHHKTIGEELRRPNIPVNCDEKSGGEEVEKEQIHVQKQEGDTYSPEHRHNELLGRIFAITTPDDIDISNVATEIMASITTQSHIQWLVDRMCDRAQSERTFAPVAAKVLGLTAHHQAGSAKVLRLLMTRLQAQFDKKDDLARTDRYKFVTSAMFLGEAYHYVKTEKNCPYDVLSKPAVTYLDMIVRPHLRDPRNHPNEPPRPQDKALDEELLIIAKLLLQNGVNLHKAQPVLTQNLVLDVTQLMCCSDLRVATRLNLHTALAELWPCITKQINSRIQHAALAAKLGVCLNV